MTDCFLKIHFLWFLNTLFHVHMKPIEGEQIIIQFSLKEKYQVLYYSKTMNK